MHGGIINAHDHACIRLNLLLNRRRYDEIYVYYFFHNIFCFHVNRSRNGIEIAQNRSDFL